MLFYISKFYPSVITRLCFFIQFWYLETKIFYRWIHYTIFLAYCKAICKIWTIPHKLNERGIKWTICILRLKIKRPEILITFAESVYHQHEVAGYHQCGALYIIKPQGDPAPKGLMRYSPNGADDIHHASRGDDIPSLRLG